MKDEYHSISGPGRAELKVKGSRFIAEALPTQTVEDASASIEAICKRDHAATHHCMAFRVGEEGDLFRYNDDGEPSGTAGPPILRQIDARNLTNTLVVVTRYYGGTKLGTGGLIRAYGEAASQALDRCTVQTCVIREAVRLRYQYEDTSPAMHTLNRFDVEVIETHYTTGTEMVVAVRRSDVDAFIEAFTGALRGRGEAQRLVLE